MNDSTASSDSAATSNSTLVIDCVSRACSVALIQDGELLGSDYQEVGRGHAERLVPMIASLPNGGRAGRVAVNCGPGSFTGVRIGLAAARALAFAWHAELVGYDSLAIVAAAAREKMAHAGQMAVIMHGGHGEFLAAIYDAQGRAVQPTTTVGPDALQRFLDTDHIAGDATDAVPASRATGRLIAQYPDARAFPLLGEHAMRPAQPVYARPPDASPPRRAVLLEPKQ